MSLPAQTVNNADAEFTVRSNGKKIGKLKISRGTIDWMPVHNSRTHYKMNWERFDQLMQQEGRQVT